MNGIFYCLGQVKAKAIMNLNAQLDEELSFMIGDEITILEVTDNGTWYKGQLGSSIGTFPAAFVQLVTPLNGSVTTNGRETPSKLHFMRTRSKSWKQEELDDVVRNMDAGKPNESTTISSRLGRTSRTKADIIAMIKNDPVSMDGTTQRHNGLDYNGLLASNKTTNTRTVKNMSNNDIDSKQSVLGKCFFQFLTFKQGVVGSYWFFHFINELLLCIIYIIYIYIM